MDGSMDGWMGEEQLGEEREAKKGQRGWKNGYSRDGRRETIGPIDQQISLSDQSKKVLAAIIRQLEKWLQVDSFFVFRPPRRV